MRTRKLFVSLALATAVIASLAGGAGAAPSENANCTGQFFGGEYARELTPLGQALSGVASSGGFGQIVAPLASTDCGTR